MQYGKVVAYASFPPTQTPRAELSHPWLGVCSRSACP
jgi:hypothetical protein